MKGLCPNCQSENFEHHQFTNDPGYTFDCFDCNHTFDTPSKPKDEDEPPKQKLAAYDTGFGLSVAPMITDENGDEETEVWTPEIVATRFFKVQLPDMNLPMDDWDREWSRQKKIIQDMIDAYNEKIDRGEAA